MPYPPEGLPGGTSLADLAARTFAGGFTMAFQPIYDVTTGVVFAQEALVRSAAGGPAAEVMDHVTSRTRYSFDRRCRIKAIAMATALGLESRLCVNCMLNAVMDPATCIRATVIAADHYGFDVGRMILEFPETEYLRDPQHLRAINASYRRAGFLTAIDDFGQGFAGLGALCDMQVDVIKLAMTLVRGIDTDPSRQRIVRSIAGLCRELGTSLVVKGVETRGECAVLRHLGVTLFQGYYLAHPLLEGLRTAPRVPLPMAA